MVKNRIKKTALWKGGRQRGWFALDGTLPTPLGYHKSWQDSWAPYSIWHSDSKGLEAMLARSIAGAGCSVQLGS